MNYGVPNQPKASHLRTNQNQKAAEGNARRLAHNYSSQIVNPSFGATNPAKYVNGHFSYSQQDNSSTALAAPARVHNIPIQVSSRFLHQQAYRGGTPPSTAQYLPLSNRSPSSTMRYYPTGREQPGREFQSRIPMARQYFGNMSLTNRNRIEQSASHFRRGSAPGSAEYEGQPGEEYLPMSYNLRHTTPERNEPQLVASYYHPPPTSNLSSASFSRRDAANHQLPSSSRLTHQERAEEEEEATREQKASSATSTIASSIHSEAIIHPDQQVVAETDILYSSSDEEDDVVRGCAQEDDLHQRLATNDDDEQASSSDESNDPELFDLQEREQIVEKYEKGPDCDDVDPWENPDFELYKITDRYGFVHKTEPVVSAEEQERRRIEREVKREAKWLRMLDEWKQHHPAKLPERIWKGVPEKLRIVFWKKLLGVEEMKSNARDNLYLELLMRARLISKDIKQIDLDINRTYRDHLAFRRRYDVKQQSLFNVLSAYAMFNTEVGYCQGMSQIAAIFLMYMDEEDAFWCLHSLMVNRKYTMHGFFVPGFPKLQRFQNHHEKVIQKYLPRVKKHFDKAGIPTIYLTKWWFGCFLDRVPFSLAIRVWDVFLYFGDSILIVMAYNIIKMHKKTILKQQLEQFMDFIQQKLADDFGFSNDRTMESLEECLKRLQSDRMALPPPPNPDDAAEVPTKPLGPSLTRSMIDIRFDLAEIHSRSSRANSLAGRSPAMKRHQSNRKPPSPMPVAPAQAQSSTSIMTVVDPVLTPTASSPTFNRRDFDQLSKPNLNGEQHSKPPITADPNLSRQLADSFGRIPSTKLSKNGRPLPPPPPPVPDADGFIPMSPRQSQIGRSGKRIQSYYDNVSTHASSGGVQSSLANINHSKETSTDRVLRAPNNVTYVAVGGVGEEDVGRRVPPSQPPQCPSPDYPQDDEDVSRKEPYGTEWNRRSIGRGTKAEYTASDQQQARWQSKSPLAHNLQYGYYPADYLNNRQPNSSITRRF